MLANYTIDGFENIKYQGFGQLKFIQNQLSELFQRFGYCQVETPTFEVLDFYSDEDAVNIDDLFKLISSKGKVLTLKPDATLPIARIAAINHHDPDEIIKLCYQTNIYKDFSSTEISKKETTQAGIEYFGNSDPSCDGEIITLAITALKLFGIKNIHIDIGHVGFINALLDELRLNKIDRDKLFNYIENKNIGDIEIFLNDKDNISDEYKEIILELPKLYGSPEKVITKMKELSITPKMKTVLNRMEQVYNYLRSLGIEDNIHFDIGFTNRMNYYSGMIFKIYLEDLGEPLISGGRYDGLSKKFGIDRPASGFGIDLILLLEYLNKKNLFPKDETPKFILLYQPEFQEEAFKICNDHRKDGRSAEMFAYQNDPQDYINKILKNSHYKNSEIYELNSEGLYKWNLENYSKTKVQ